jgi:hypothetical protein
MRKAYITALSIYRVRMLVIQTAAILAADSPDYAADLARWYDSANSGEEIAQGAAMFFTLQCTTVARVLPF